MFADLRDKDDKLIEQPQKQIFDLMRERDQLQDQVRRYADTIGFLEEQVAALAKRNDAIKLEQRWAGFKPGDMK